MTTASVDLADAIGPLVRAEMERWSVPGMSIGVLHDGVVETAAFGVTNIETGYPVTPETLFQYGSISKVYTTTVAMQLVEVGALDLDAPVTEYLPRFRLDDQDATRALRVRHLLSHTGGFYGDRQDDFGPGDDALARAVAAFASLPQYTRPGELYAYSNTGFHLAGAIIERIAGDSFERVMRRCLFRPLGLGRSYYFAHEAITNPVAIGHNKPADGPLRVARRYAHPRCTNPAGAIIGPVGDLLAFAAFHMGNASDEESPMLTQTSLDAMRTPRVDAISTADFYGLGWALSRAGDTMLVHHGGSTNGFRSRLTLLPEHGFAFAALSNANGGRAAIHAIERSVIEQYAGLQLQDPPAIPLDPQTLARFAGRYQRLNADVVLTVADGGLHMQTLSHAADGTLVPAESAPLLPIGERRFLVTDGEYTGETVDFVLGENGSIRFLRQHGRLTLPTA